MDFTILRNFDFGEHIMFIKYFGSPMRNYDYARLKDFNGDGEAVIECSRYSIVINRFEMLFLPRKTLELMLDAMMVAKDKSSIKGELRVSTGYNFMWYLIDRGY